MKTNKSWEDQLSAVYNQMTGAHVDFGRCKERDRRIRAARRKKNKDLAFAEIDTRKPTNENKPGYSGRENICNITVAVLPTDFVIDPKRMDAPCEMCINEQCKYSMGRR